MKNISEAELEIMNFIWDLNRDVSVKDVQDHFYDSYTWKVTTVQTFLKRLTEKSYLEVVKLNRSNSYRPLISKSEYTLLETGKIIDKVHFGSIKNFISALVDVDDMSQSEIDELRKWLDKND